LGSGTMKLVNTYTTYLQPHDTAKTENSWQCQNGPSDTGSTFLDFEMKNTIKQLHHYPP
jgi:hypothetical protein